MLSAGPSCDEVAAALSAFEETKDFRQDSREFFAGEYRKAFAPFVRLPGKAGVAVLSGVIGAAEALSQAAATGRMSRAEAVAALTRITVGALAPHAAQA